MKPGPGDADFVIFLGWKWHDRDRLTIVRNSLGSPSPIEIGVSPKLLFISRNNCLHRFTPEIDFFTASTI
jgi:hypothetical protein